MKDLSIANVKPNHKLITLGKQWYYLKQKILTCPDLMEDELLEQMEKVENIGMCSEKMGKTGKMPLLSADVGKPCCIRGIVL